MKSVSRSGWLVALAMVVLAAGSTAQATVIGYDMEAITIVGSKAGFPNVLNVDPTVDRGRINNGVTQETVPPAKFGTFSALFDASTKNLAPFNNLNLGATATIMAHVYLPGNVSGGRLVLGKAQSPWNTPGMYDFRIDNGKVGLLLRGGPWIQSAAAVVTPDAWNHVAATFDNGLVTIYHNGVQVAQQDVSGIYGTAVPTLTNVNPTVGNLAPGGAQLGGYMDDFYFNDTAALDAATIGFYANNTITDVIPEPATSALLGLGGIMVLIRRRKVD